MSPIIRVLIITYYYYYKYASIQFNIVNGDNYRVDKKKIYL